MDIFFLTAAIVCCAIAAVIFDYDKALWEAFGVAYLTIGLFLSLLSLFL